MGGERDTSSYGQTLGGQGRSRGYERDNDEYDDSGFGQGQGQDAGTGRAPKSSMGSKVLGQFWIFQLSSLPISFCA
jgi:hypothetical protein